MRLRTKTALVWSTSLMALLTLGCGAGSSDPGGEDLPDPSSLCPDHLSSGAGFGIQPVPAEFADSYGKIFCKYTEVTAPSGGAIRLFAQREVSNEQVLYARGVLEFYLENVPGSRHGADKAAIANKMVDNEATLLLLKGHDGEFEIFEDESMWRVIDGQPLYEDEIAVPGSAWYVDNVYEGHRDATFEEILHLVHDNGIGIDFEGAPPGAAPEFQQEIRAAQINALEIDRIWAQDERVAEWLEEIREEGSLTQEYLASVIDSYYGLWGPFTEREGGMWGFYVAGTREEIAEKDPMGYELMAAFFNPYLTFEARIDPGFEGVFSMDFDPSIPYTHKSRYLTRASLTGDRDSGLKGNGKDNVLTGNRGANHLEGGAGDDTAVFQGPFSDYAIEDNGSILVVTDRVEGRDGSDRLTTIEWLQFEDGRRSVEELLDAG